MQPQGFPGNPKPRYQARWVGNSYAATVLLDVFPVLWDPGGFNVAASFRLIGVVDFFSVSF